MEMNTPGSEAGKRLIEGCFQYYMHGLTGYRQARCSECFAEVQLEHRCLTLLRQVLQQAPIELALKVIRRERGTFASLPSGSPVTRIDPPRCRCVQA